MFAVRRIVTAQNITTDETSYYIKSLDSLAEKLLQITREHWKIESKFMKQTWQDIDLLIGISGNANGYVQMSALDGEPYGDGVDNGALAELMKMGYENLGATFNFTVGRETAEHFLFVCQRFLTEILDNINSPTWHHKFPDNYSAKDDE